MNAELLIADLVRLIPDIAKEIPVNREVIIRGLVINAIHEHEEKKVKPTAAQ